MDPPDGLTDPLLTISDPPPADVSGATSAGSSPQPAATAVAAPADLDRDDDR